MRTQGAGAPDHRTQGAHWERLPVGGAATAEGQLLFNRLIEVFHDVLMLEGKIIIVII